MGFSSHVPVVALSVLPSTVAPLSLGGAVLTGLPARLRARARAPRARRATPAKPVLHQAGTVHGPAGRAKRRCARAFGADGSRRAEHAEDGPRASAVAETPRES